MQFSCISNLFLELLTINAGVYARFPPIAVKLKGDTAAINPSIPRYLMVFFVTLGSSDIGWYFVASFRKYAFNLKKIIQNYSNP